jgi:hypothetical protein
VAVTDKVTNVPGFTDWLMGSVVITGVDVCAFALRGASAATIERSTAPARPLFSGKRKANIL